QDGCNNFCSYCIIPYARGRACSKPMERVLEQVDRIIAQDIKEIVLTGIHIASYGKDIGGYGLTELLEAIHQRTEGTGVRIRLGSLDPRVVTEDFVKRISVLDRICPQFHLSLQSGCDTVLERMNRHYTAEEYMAGVELLRRYFDSPSITTDIIVGFPGETEEEFAQTLAFAQRVGFAKIHIFPYSRRDGTVAAKMNDQIPKSVASEREKRLSAVESATRGAYIAATVGKRVQVLFEEEKNIDGENCFCGYTPQYVYVGVKGQKGLENTVRWVKIIGYNDELAIGELEEGV
ncbi:MAG: MiaB/RimO family radical SAM methylthiotransferase, partial [Clostridia bacterium]|nr:MiaB/RimO family radical SAM methylthiotransferase [Clostridia bacterium]